MLPQPYIPKLFIYEGIDITPEKEALDSDPVTLS